MRTLMPVFVLIYVPYLALADELWVGYGRYFGDNLLLWDSTRYIVMGRCTDL